MAPKPNIIPKILFYLLMFPILALLIRGMKSKSTAIKHQFKATHKKIILFILMFSILVLLILGILITLWYTFGEKMERKGEAPDYVSTAAFLNREVC